jgi:hypothetical protein
MPGISFARPESRRFRDDPQAGRTQSTVCQAGLCRRGKLPQCRGAPGEEGDIFKHQTLIVKAFYWSVVGYIQFRNSRRDAGATVGAFLMRSGIEGDDS